MLKEYPYKRNIIRQCERPSGEHTGEWIIVEIFHGMEIADELCTHYRSVRSAKLAVTKYG